MFEAIKHPVSDMFVSWTWSLTF